MLGAGAVPRDGVLTVHAAFHGLSRAGARAENFCQALVDHMAGGTLLMPAMTWRTVNPAQPVFDELNTPSHTGVLGETFRVAFATHRSLHPTHSTAGRGPRAAEFLSRHHLAPTPCGPDSPYGMLHQAGGWVLLLGVGLECCTAIHHVEEQLAPDVFLEREEAQPYRLIARDGRVFSLRLRRHRRLPRDFPKFGPALAARGRQVGGILEGTPWMLFPAADLYQTVIELFSINPRATLGDGSPL